MRTSAALLVATLLFPAKPAALLVSMDPPAKPGSMAPNLSLDGKTVVLSWLEPPNPRVKPQDGNYALRMSRFDGRRWTPPVTIASGTDFFANWADFPSVTAGARGRMIAHWAAKSGADTYAYDVRLAGSNDGGRTWRPMGPAHDDRTPTEHGFVSAVAEGDRIRIFWLDGRETAARPGGHDSHSTEGAMTLRTALVSDRVEKSELLDSRVCDCCQTAAAATSRGPIVAYRDRSADEVRDIAVVGRDTARWTKPATVFDEGWEIAGCPVNGPALAAEGRQVAVAWYTQGANRPRVQVAFSDDAGASFRAPVTVDAREPLGRVDAILDGNGDAIVGWVAAEGKGAAIRLARVNRAGRVGPALTVARTETGRSSGFPRLERTGGTLVVAWVEPSDPFRLRAATVAAAAVR
jgi:hypothetical protein